jgi:catechol 2,3-dioxygenase-like lactoylglutathione lyase family enzyme
MNNFISGIQQVGIGVGDARESLLLYKNLFGMDVLVFDDLSEARLMTQYTGGTVYKRRALLSLNLHGGGGFEIWQFQDRKPAQAAVPPMYGDIGIYAPKLKCANVQKAHAFFTAQQNISVLPVERDANNKPHFWVKDLYQNVFNIVLGNHWFQPAKKSTGGVSGAVIGVTDMERSVHFYRAVLGIAEVVYDVSGPLAGKENEGRFRRVLLQKKAAGSGAFGKLLGPVEIELVQCLDRTPAKLFANRFWGDCGFIHLCFDVPDMEALKTHAQQAGFPFTVDSSDSFDMENASGRFCYVEDPDGTLIELVETHKVPILKNWGWYLDLKKRNGAKPLPGWMIRLLALRKVR